MRRVCQEAWNFISRRRFIVWFLSRPLQRQSLVVGNTVARRKDATAGPVWVPLSSSVGGRDAAAPYEALRCDAIVAISKGSTRPRYFTVFLPPLSSFFSPLGREGGSIITKYESKENGRAGYRVQLLESGVADIIFGRLGILPIRHIQPTFCCRDSHSARL
jgi:hypothetical protein